MADYEVVRTKVRGQCEQGHVIKGEVFGPELDAEWIIVCPIPGCGHGMTWQRRPDRPEGLR
jgi:hypothetical protein